MERFPLLAIVVLCIINVATCRSVPIIAKRQDTCSAANSISWNDNIEGILTLTLVTRANDSSKQFGDCQHLFVSFDKEQQQGPTMTITSNLANTVKVQVAYKKANDGGKALYVYQAEPGQDCTYDIPESFGPGDATEVRVEVDKLNDQRPYGYYGPNDM